MYQMTEQIANENQCPMCCGPATTEIIESELAYGCEPNTVVLQVHDLPVRGYKTCDFMWLDNEGERIQHKAVCDYLGCDPDEVLAERKRLKNERLQNSDQR